MNENKQLILDHLLKALQNTRDAYDLVSLTYNNELEEVTAVFESGGRRTINVRMDSGTAMIRDVMSNLGC